MGYTTLQPFYLLNLLYYKVVRSFHILQQNYLPVKRTYSSTTLALALAKFQVHNHLPTTLRYSLALPPLPHSFVITHGIRVCSWPQNVQLGVVICISNRPQVAQLIVGTGQLSNLIKIKSTTATSSSGSNSNSNNNINNNRVTETETERESSSHKANTRGHCECITKC